MSARRKLPSESIMAGWVENGMTHEEIAKRISEDIGEPVSRTSVSGALSRAGYTKRLRYDDYIPWTPVSLKHNSAYQLTMLRIGARMHADHESAGKVTVGEKKRFNKWVKELQDKGLVVHYDYNTPDGFFYVPRRSQDTGLVRSPDPIAKAG